MDTCMLTQLPKTGDLVRKVQELDEPVIMLDGEDECLVAMRPKVFERILFDCDLLNSVHRESLHL